MTRAAELARARGALTLSEDDALVWFGVGLAVLERIEAGQIIPSAEVEQRIDSFLVHSRRWTPSAALPGARAGTHTPSDPSEGAAAAQPPRISRPMA